MTVMTHAAVSFSFSFVFTRDLQHTLHYITYFMAHSFYAFLAPPIVVGVLLTCQSLDQGYSIGGPWAQSSLPIIFIRPEEEYAGCTFASNCSCTNKFVHKAAKLAWASQKEKRETQ